MFKDELARYFYLSVARFKAGVSKALEYVKRGDVEILELYRVAYSVIGNKRYADGGTHNQNIIKSTKSVEVDASSIELGDWWMLQSRGSPRREDRADLLPALKGEGSL